MNQLQTVLTKDPANNKMNITRTFQAPVKTVWKAWTEPRLLDQWWAPKPWKAETKSMEFREGGTWLYCMVGPDGTRTWSRADYEKIEPQKHFTGMDAFCDEEGNINKDFPQMHWQVNFSEAGDATLVTVVITLSSKEDLQKILDLGFQEGFSAAHGNLDELLSKKLQQAG